MPDGGLLSPVVADVPLIASVPCAVAHGCVSSAIALVYGRAVATTSVDRAALFCRGPSLTLRALVLQGTVATTLPPGRHSARPEPGASATGRGFAGTRVKCPLLVMVVGIWVESAGAGAVRLPDTSIPAPRSSMRSSPDRFRVLLQETEFGRHPRVFMARPEASNAYCDRHLPYDSALARRRCGRPELGVVSAHRSSSRFAPPVRGQFGRPLAGSDIRRIRHVSRDLDHRSCRRQKGPDLPGRARHRRCLQLG